MEIRDCEYWENRNILAKILTKINYIIFRIRYGYGFCLTCYKWTFHLHDSSEQSYHCNNCCYEKLYIY